MAGAALAVGAVVGAAWVFTIGTGGISDHDENMFDLGRSASITITMAGEDASLLTCALRFTDLQQQRADLVRADVAWFTVGCLPEGSSEARLVAESWGVDPADAPR